jgi:hypothetical protein
MIALIILDESTLLPIDLMTILRIERLVLGVAPVIIAQDTQLAGGFILIHALSSCAGSERSPASG